MCVLYHFMLRITLQQHCWLIKCFFCCLYNQSLTRNKKSFGVLHFKLWNVWNLWNDEMSETSLSSFCNLYKLKCLVQELACNKNLERPILDCKNHFLKTDFKNWSFWFSQTYYYCYKAYIWKATSANCCIPKLRKL